MNRWSFKYIFHCALSRQGVGLLFPVILIISIATLFSTSESSNQGPIATSECLECHEASEHEKNLPYNTLLGGSAHEGFECADCHTGIAELPHDDPVAKVDCGTCHDDAAETYKWHGRNPYPGGKDIPTCTDCHGIHDILPSSNPDSRTSVVNLPTTCGVCHENVDLVKKHDILYGQAVTVYRNSVHGKAAQGGIGLVATCTDCHSTGGSAHRILVPGNAESSINHFNIPNTCAKCHADVARQYWDGIHGKLVSRGETGSPVCTNCHGEHGIIAHTDPRSPVSATRVAEATCSPCHESAYLNEKYGIPTGRLTSWVDSYHGLKSRAGDVAVANCASCHGAHMILPSADSLSSIHANNLQHTCGKCHPGIAETLAKTSVHGQPGMSSTKVAQIVGQLYVVAIFLIIGTMLLHWAIDYRKQIRLVTLKEQVVRMTTDEVWQHTLLMISFIVLVITGFALRYSDSWWANLLFGREGGFPSRGTIHRVSAVLFTITSVWHFFFLFTPRGKTFVRDMWPRKLDLIQFWQMIRFNLDRTEERPRFGRFSYVEKAEYWALVWGTIVMFITGVFLWWDNIAVEWFPKGFLDVMLVVHFYEAVLASLAILIWHMYSTIFSPGVYPMNPAWFTGKVPKDVYHHEHPGDPMFVEDRHPEVDELDGKVAGGRDREVHPPTVSPPAEDSDEDSRSQKQGKEPG
ncbi:MAG: cytochrome c3 family protein [Candidatus Zixiibacteriota bacterium]